MKKNITIYSWNVNGLRAVARNGFVDWVSNAKPDILCLQEIKANKEDIPEEIKKIKGYHLYSSSAEKKGYAGTAVLTKIKPIKIIDKIGIDEFDKEGRSLLLEFDKFYLFNVYFPNAQRELKRLPFKEKFNEAYLKFIKKLKDKPLILTGDFNVAHKEIDLKNPQQNTKNAGFTIEERNFIDKLIKMGFSDSFRRLHPEKIQYSWWTYRFHARDKNIGWRIDYFFVANSLMKQIKKAEIMNNVYGSDHCPIVIEIYA